MSTAKEPRVTQLHYSRSRRLLQLTFNDDTEFTLQTGKSSVAITRIDPVGHYAAQITFDDGHDSGLYSWSYLRDLAERQDHYWQTYLKKLAAEGKSRDPELQVLHFEP